MMELARVLYFFYTATRTANGHGDHRATRRWKAALEEAGLHRCAPGASYGRRILFLTAGGEGATLGRALWPLGRQKRRCVLIEPQAGIKGKWP